MANNCFVSTGECNQRVNGENNCFGSTGECNQRVDVVHHCYGSTGGLTAPALREVEKYAVEVDLNYVASNGGDKQGVVVKISCFGSI